MTSVPRHISFEKDEFIGKYKGSLTFTNGRIYKGDLSPINGNVMGILEIEDGSYYPISFHFIEGSCIDFDEITDSYWATTLLYGYTPKFGINSNKKPFNKEYISKIFNFERYKNDVGSVNIHLAFQHWMGMYDGNNIGYIAEGKGKLIYKNGDIYEGEFKNGIPEGKGKLIFNKYGIMEGEFKDGKLTGEGVSSYPNRGEYRGEFYMGRPHGRGTITYTNGEKHRGKWEDGKFIG